MKTYFIVVVIVLFTALVYAKSENTEQPEKPAEQHITIEYCQGQKFYVLSDDNGSPVAFMKY
jgi:hypothetical protein